MTIQDGWNRLRLDEDRVAASDIDTDGWQFDEAVRSGRLRLPCATTPAADENGRPAPKGTRGKMTADVRARWLADRRRFAPWHYRKEAMLTDGQGRLQIPTPDIKEQLHHIPKGYTAVEGIDDRTRHRLIGNGWHWGVARKLLTLVVAAMMTPTGASMEIATPPKQSTLQWVVGQPCNRGPNGTKDHWYRTISVRRSTGRRHSRYHIRPATDQTSNCRGSEGKSSRTYDRWWRTAPTSWTSG